jgi:hypothetical protein
VSDDLDQFKALFERRFPSGPQKKALRVSVSDDEQVSTLFEIDAAGEMLTH